MSHVSVAHARTIAALPLVTPLSTSLLRSPAQRRAQILELQRRPDAPLSGSTPACQSHIPLPSKTSSPQICPRLETVLTQPSTPPCRRRAYLRFAESGESDGASVPLRRLHCHFPVFPELAFDLCAGHAHAVLTTSASTGTATVVPTSLAMGHSPFRSHSSTSAQSSE
ncbi:hypothetical protein K438DRAFT_2026707 [Mycena galopus ATCC 62051]|nr:hypothetical protein K438DRAFT_2026707 [Mycena galopus ATCC 62051]